MFDTWMCGCVMRESKDLVVLEASGTGACDLLNRQVHVWRLMAGMHAMRASSTMSRD